MNAFEEKPTGTACAPGILFRLLLLHLFSLLRSHLREKKGQFRVRGSGEDADRSRATCNAILGAGFEGFRGFKCLT